MLAAALLLLGSAGNFLLPSGKTTQLRRRLEELNGEFRDRLLEIRLLARKAGYISIAKQFSVDVPKIIVEPRDIVAVEKRADKFTRVFAERFYRARADNEASPLTEASQALRDRVRITAETQASEVFGESRQKLIRDTERARPDLVAIKSWIADFTQRPPWPCDVCDGLDGHTILAAEPWPYGEPGSAHPNCYCSEDYDLVPRDEAYSRLR